MSTNVQFLKKDPTVEMSSKEQLTKDESINVTALNFMLTNLGRRETRVTLQSIRAL